MNKEELLELSDTLRGIAEGKEWEMQWRDGTWSCPGAFTPLEALNQDYDIRLKLWSLPKPPEGLEWHREDGWTEEMLAGGLRPYCKGEVLREGDPCFDSRKEREIVVGLADGLPEDHPFWYFTTSAPLPTPKKKQKVPLGLADVPPGSVIRSLSDYWEMVTELSPEGVRIGNRCNKVRWDELLEYWSIKRPGEDWQPCYKEVEVEA